jgi:glycosyltransferase involved in cell wall biosynthesis
MRVNLLLFNLATDRNHVTLAFGIRWISELARRFAHVDVVTMYEGSYSLPANVSVWSVGREKGYSRLRRAFNFYGIVFRVLRTRRIDVAFTHMIHGFAVLFWPIGRVLGIRNLLWYAHGSVPLGLRLAHWAADGIVSSTCEGFRIRSRKIAFLGQGIDVSEFAYEPRRPSRSEFRIVSVGRISPVKRLDVLVEALEKWRLADGRPWRLDIAGAATSAPEAAYESWLQKRAARPGTNACIRFHGRLESAGIRELLREADVFVNLSGTGSLDKAIVEAMASGCVVLSSNDAFCAIARKEGFEECCADAEVDSVADGLTRLSDLDDTSRRKLANRMREIAVRDHSLDRLIDRLTEILTSMAGSGVGTT